MSTTDVPLEIVPSGVTGEGPSRGEQVAKPDDRHKARVRERALTDALMDGSDAMRMHGRDFLPQEPAEDDSEYRVRLERTFLKMHAYRDSVTRMRDTPFTQAPLLHEDDLDSRLRDLVTDVDLHGTTLEQAMKRSLGLGIHRGIVWAIVNTPKGASEASREQSELAGARPFVLIVDDADVLGVRFEKNDFGKHELAQFRYRYVETVKTGVYGSKPEKRIRVWTRDALETWRQKSDKSNEYELVSDETMAHDFKRVPVEWALYDDESEGLLASSLMKPLADLELFHWQQHSDHLNVLRIGRILRSWSAGRYRTTDGLTGVNEGAATPGQVPIGSNRHVHSDDSQFKMDYLEPDGKSIQHSSELLAAIELQMHTVGVQVWLREQGGALTAQAERDNQQGSRSKMEVCVQRTEQFWSDIVALANSMLNSPQTPEQPWRPNLWADFDVSAVGTPGLTELQKLRERGDIDQETMLRETQRYRVLSDRANLDEIMESTAVERERRESLGPDPIVE